MRKKLQMKQQNSLTFEELYAEYVLEMKSRNLRAGTLKHYSDSIKQIYKLVPPDTLLSDIDEDFWNQFKIAMADNEELNDVSAYTYGRDFKTLLRFAMKKEYIPRLELALPKADKAPTETYTDEELAKLMKKPNLKKCSFTEYKTWVIVNFLLSTGVRQNSLINIKIKDVDFSADLLHVNVTKNRKPLLIPLNSDIKRILQEYLKYRQAESDDEYLFCNEYGKPLVKSTLYHSMYEYNKARGVEQTGIHRYRHTFAKKWILAGGNVVTLSKILGHSSLQITQNYINLLVTDMAQDVEQFNCEPSKEDAEVTDRLMKAYNMIGINVADHIIMTPGREYYSFFEHGKLTFDAPEYETEPVRVNLQSQRVAEAADFGRKDASEGKKSGRKISEEKISGRKISGRKITERKTSVREKLRTGAEEGKTAGTGAVSWKTCSSREPQKRKAEHDRI